MSGAAPRYAALALAALALAACAPSAVPARPAATAPRRPPADLAAVVAALGRDASAIRGLALARPVPVRVEAPEAIARHLREELAADRDELDVERKVGVALGVLPPGTDLVDVLARFVGAEAQGYYDPDEGVLVLTTTEAGNLGAAGPEGLEARATVVHELTHALQHQHFAGRVAAGRQPPPLSDAARARLSLLEGDATLVGMEWVARRRGGQLLGSPEMGARIARWAAGAQVLTEVDAPPYLIDSAELPYEAGAAAVGALHRLGGWARVDAALADAALNTAEVLHPDRAGVAYVAVATPADPALEARGLRRTLARSLGEMELRLYLRAVMRDERAAALAAHWRGDALALYEGPAGLAARWVIACDDEAAARDVAAGLAPLATRWSRGGCPGVAGGDGARCPGTITAAGATVVVARGT